MEKKGQTITIVVIIGIIIVLGLIIWQTITIINKISTNTTEQEGNLTESETNATIPEGADINETDGEANETDTNETEQPEDESVSNVIPNPTGSITSIDREDNEIGEYFCNNTGNDTVNPEHKIKVYTYKLIGSSKNLSENYIESEKVTNVCESYGNVSINYYIEWKWDAVEGIDGYRIYQHYSDEDVAREYDYYVDLRAEKLIDTGLDLWIKETSPSPVNSS